MTLPHYRYDQVSNFGAFYERNERATGIEPAFRVTRGENKRFPRD
jgi:hypothetical protein